MAQSIKLADDVMKHVRRESSLQSRSIAGQITHWINIGRAIEQSDTFDYQRINAVLQAALSPDELNPDEQEVWFEHFTAEMKQPTTNEIEFFKKRRTLGRGVGMNDAGELIYQEKPD